MRLTGLVDLKIYLCGLLLSDPDDPVIGFLNDLNHFGEGSLHCLAENASRLVGEIPFRYYLDYTDIEQLAIEQEMNIVRFTNLKLYVSEVRDTQRFLDLLKN